jgi:hypothetical protein
LYGIGPKHIKKLCENPWEGGLGLRPKDVAEMTLDQVFFMLADIEDLRGSGIYRTKKTTSLEALNMIRPDKDGKFKGVDKDGNPIKARIGGESLAARLNREKEERELRELQREQERKRKGKSDKDVMTRKQRQEARQRRRERRERKRKNGN